MVIVKIGDGLGNQIYNYVCGYAVSRYHNEELKLDTSECDNSTLRSYMLGNFSLDAHERESFPNKSVWQKIYKRLRRNIKYHVIMENIKKNGLKLDERAFKKKYLRDIYLHGYWQNIEYFKMYQSDILRQLKPAYKQSDDMKKTSDFLRENNTCAIHMRGGDIEMLPIEYFKKAISTMDEKKGKPIYIVFSNQMEKAKDYLKKLNITYREISDYGKFSDVDEFFLMSSCQSQIISNSTYSIWAALISENKLVVAPDCNIYNEIIYPDEWILI